MSFEERLELSETRDLVVDDAWLEPLGEACKYM